MAVEVFIPAWTTEIRLIVAHRGRALGPRPDHTAPRVIPLPSRAGQEALARSTIDKVENGGPHDRTPLFDRGRVHSRDSFPHIFTGAENGFVTALSGTRWNLRGRAALARTVVVGNGPTAASAEFRLTGQHANRSLESPPGDRQSQSKRVKVSPGFPH